MVLAHRLAAGLVPAAAVLLCLGAAAVSAAPYQDPPVFSSKNGALRILMIAAKRPHVALGDVTTDLWTYEVCRLPAPGANACPSGTGHAGLGGVRLALQPGDTLSIRLINDLPPLTAADADHIADQPTLIGNPTNLHTHGLIVEPHRAVGPSDTYGDYVFLELRNTHNPIPAGAGHPGIDIARNAVEYEYNIETAHPTGLFWFHPHLHGLSLNQVSAGMSGAITIGNPADVCGNAGCVDALNGATIRHLVLKDTQVAPGNILKTQEEPEFCAGAPTTGRIGFCRGQRLPPASAADPGFDYSGGKWFHSVSGQIYPTIDVGPSGDVWRILNASGSRSYALSLVDQASGAPLPLQLLSIDGVTLAINPSTSVADLTTRLAGKAKPIRCPGALTIGEGRAVCVATIEMMPSSRVEVRVVRSDRGGTVEHAVFETAEYPTGDNGAGDAWPQIDLAAVLLQPRNIQTPSVVALKDVTATTLSAGGQLLAPALLRVPGSSTMLPASTAGLAVAVAATGPAVQDFTQAPTAAVTPRQLAGAVEVANCAPLAPGHHRKILFGYPQPTTFGLGYVEVDAHGRDIEATRIPITPFNPTIAAVCVPLPGGNAVSELWELQNLTDEDHNFHIHQTHFFVVQGGVPPGTTMPQVLNGNLVLVDNVPVPRPANGPPCADGTIDAVRSGACVPSKTFVVIPFREIGDFVFHCHILEHEDGGMMARIRVVATR